MALIRPNQLPVATTPLNESDVLVVDQGAGGVTKATSENVVDAAAPVPSQGEAEAGTDNKKRMTALRTKQSIASQVGVTLASNAQGLLANSAVQPDRQVIAGSGLTGGGSLSSDVTINVGAGTGISVAADSIGLDATTQSRLLISGGTALQVLQKNSGTDYDVSWATIAGATAVSYAPQSLTTAEQRQARINIDVVQAGYKSGMVLSNNAADINNDIDISSGVRMADDGSNWLRLGSTLTKRLDASWAVGTGNGMLDTGTKANSESYALFVIGGSAVATDVLASTSFSAPTMPTGYTWKRYLGTIVTSSTGNIFSFSQIGNYFRRLTITGGSYTGTIGTTSSLAALSVPRGISCQIDLQWRTLNASANGFIYLRNPDDTDISVAGPANANIGGVGTNVSFIGTISVFSDTSRQLAARAQNASTTLDLSIRGWTDPYL